MEKSVYDVTDKIRHQLQGLTMSESIDVEGTFVVKLCALKQEIFFYTNLSLNERDNNIDNQLSFNNYKQIVSKLHDSGWKNSSHISADVDMLGYGCGVSVYPYFYLL